MEKVDKTAWLKTNVDLSFWVNLYKPKANEGSFRYDGTRAIKLTSSRMSRDRICTPHDVYPALDAKTIIDFAYLLYFLFPILDNHHLGDHIACKGLLPKWLELLGICE